MSKGRCQVASMRSEFMREIQSGETSWQLGLVSMFMSFKVTQLDEITKEVTVGGGVMDSEMCFMMCRYFSGWKN